MADNEIRVSAVSDGLIVDGRSVSRTVVTEAAGFVALRPQARGCEGTPAVAWLLPAKRLRNRPTVCTNCMAGRMATTLRIGYVLNSDSFATPRSCKA